jgi:hypothetical protein
MAAASPITITKLASIPGAFSKARNQPICRCSRSRGWRIPFLFGLIIGPVGLYIRRHLDETDAFIEASAVPRQESGLGSILASHLSEAMVSIGIVSAGTIQFYVILLYMPTFATSNSHFGWERGLCKGATD